MHASHTFQEPGGGGAVAAVQLMKLAGSATLYTAFGDDEVGHRSRARLEELGLDIEGGFRPEPQRRGFVHVDERGERTITVLGPRLGPHGADPLAWDGLDGTDAVYLTAGDVEAVRHARRARVLVATPRGLGTLSQAHVELDALVSSGRDPGELYRLGDLDPRAAARGAHARCGRGRMGDRRRASAGSGGRRRSPARSGTPMAPGTASRRASPTASVQGWEIAKAVELAARCGAACMTGRGPYEGQLTPLTQATCPSAGSIGRPSATQAFRPPSRLCAS